jgi:hypothetical protein
MLENLPECQTLLIPPLPEGVAHFVVTRCQSDVTDSVNDKIMRLFCHGDSILNVSTTYLAVSVFIVGVFIFQNFNLS